MRVCVCDLNTEPSRESWKVSWDWTSEERLSGLRAKAETTRDGNGPVAVQSLLDRSKCSCLDPNAAGRTSAVWRQRSRRAARWLACTRIIRVRTFKLPPVRPQSCDFSSSSVELRSPFDSLSFIHKYDHR